MKSDEKIIFLRKPFEQWQDFDEIIDQNNKTMEQNNWYKIGQKQKFWPKNDQNYLPMQNFDLKTLTKKIDQIFDLKNFDEKNCSKFWSKDFDKKN